MCVSNQLARRRQAGFTLAELMVSLVLSLLVMLAALSIAQSVAASQRQTASMESTIVSAMAALQSMKYESAQAGLGMYADGSLICNYFNISVGTTVVAQNTPVMPITAVNSAAASTLTLVYGTAIESGIPNYTREGLESAADSVEVAGLTIAKAGDDVLIAGDKSTPCTLRSVTAVEAAADELGYTLSFGNTGLHNQATFASPASYQTDSQVFAVRQLRKTIFALEGTNLVMRRPFDKDSPSMILARDVMAFVVQYGSSSGSSTTVTSLLFPRGDDELKTSTQLGNLRALRLGLVLRSPQKSKPNADGKCEATTVQPSVLDHTLSLQGDWQCFRYRSLTATVPLRSIMMGAS